MRDQRPAEERVNLVRGKPVDKKVTDDAKEAKKKLIQQEKARIELHDSSVALAAAFRKKRPTSIPPAGRPAAAPPQPPNLAQPQPAVPPKPNKGRPAKVARMAGVRQVPAVGVNQVTDRDLQLVLESRRDVTKSNTGFRFASGAIHNIF